MKVYICVDSEGISGNVGGLDDVTRSRWMAEDANAAVTGVFDGGATEVVVKDACGTATTIDPEQLDERARLIRGWTPEMCMVGTLDETFDALLLVGAHARNHTEKGVLHHTHTGRIDEVRVNGRPFGEVGLNAGVAGHYGVPVVMVSGDEAVCAEASDLLGAVEAVCVKKGLAKHSAEIVPLKAARQMIHSAARRAVSDISRFRPLVLDRPIEFEVEMPFVARADMAALVPGVEKTGPRTVRASASDPLQMHRLMRVIFVMASAD